MIMPTITCFDTAKALLSQFGIPKKNILGGQWEDVLEHFIYFDEELDGQLRAALLLSGKLKKDEDGDLFFDDQKHMPAMALRDILGLLPESSRTSDNTVPDPSLTLQDIGVSFVSLNWTSTNSRQDYIANWNSSTDSFANEVPAERQLFNWHRLLLLGLIHELT
jgi:hypothetical protein